VIDTGELRPGHRAAGLPRKLPVESGQRKDRTRQERSLVPVKPAVGNLLKPDTDLRHAERKTRPISDYPAFRVLCFVSATTAATIQSIETTSCDPWLIQGWS
jgi:hypothetical protein